MMRPVTLVIPCKNEALRLNPEAFRQAVGELQGLSLLFVDDGSTDATASVLAHLAGSSPAIDALYLRQNVGKAEAVRAGIRHLLAGGGEGLVGFWDADLATPLEEVRRFVQEFERDDRAELVVGSRWPHLGARIDRTIFRNCTGACMKFLIRCVLTVPVYDTQCGAKVMTRALAARLFARPFVSRWLFDVELLRRMGRRAVLRGVRELPLDDWRDVGGSKMTFRAAVCSVFDLFRIACAA
ncbi:MAG: glycosyltransferase [Kiritimatiellia bacterium]